MQAEHERRIRAQHAIGLRERTVDALHVVQRVQRQRQVLALVLNTFELLDVALEKRYQHALAIRKPAPVLDLLVRQVDPEHLSALLREHDAVLSTTTAEHDYAASGNVAEELQFVLPGTARAVGESIRGELIPFLVRARDRIPGRPIVRRRAAGQHRYWASRDRLGATALEPITQGRRKRQIRQLVVRQPARILVVTGRAEAQITLVADHPKDVCDVALAARVVLEVERLRELLLVGFDAQLAERVPLQRLLSRLFLADDRAGQQPLPGERRQTVLAPHHQHTARFFEQRQRQDLRHRLVSQASARRRLGHLFRALDCAEQRLRLVHCLLMLALRLAVVDDAAPRLHVGDAVLHHHGA